MTAYIGANLSRMDDTTTALTEGKAFGLGDRFVDKQGNEYKYVSFTNATAQYDVVAIDNDFAATGITPTLMATTQSPVLAIAQATATSGQRGWALTYGHNVSCNVSATATANVALYAATTTGKLSTTASSGTLRNVVLMTSTSATAAAAAVAVLWNNASNATLRG